MTLPIRAYLMLRSALGDWSVSVWRDLDAILVAWRGRPEPEGTVGVLHIGFDRPASPLFDVVAERYPGKMLVTAAAMYALPHGFEYTKEPIGKVENQPIYLATAGWGYFDTDDSAVRVSSLA